MTPSGPVVIRHLHEAPARPGFFLASLRAFHVMRILPVFLVVLCALVSGVAGAQDGPAASVADDATAAGAEPQDAPTGPADAEGGAPTDDRSAPDDGAAGQNEPSPGPGDASGPPPLGDVAGGGVPASGFANADPAPRADTVNFPSSNETGDGGGAYLYVGLGVGVLVLLGVGLLWGRQGEDSDDLPDFVQRLPEPPLIGAPLPPLSDGVQVWHVDAADEALLLRDLLTTLADAHRVLVVASGSRDLPHVAGGPVYRVQGTRPVHLEEPIDMLDQDGGRTVAALWLLSNAQWATMQAFADLLPAGVGGVLLTAEPPSAEQLPFPVVTFTARDGGWMAECQGSSLVVVRAPDGRLVSGPKEQVA